MTEFYFKGIKVSCCDLSQSVKFVFEHLSKDISPAYICVTDTGNIVNAYKRSPMLKEAINNSFLSLPDGRPLSMFANSKKICNTGRVAGPDFMKEVFRNSRGREIKHFFLGDTDDVLKRIKDSVEKKFDLKVCGTFSPDLDIASDETDEIIIKKINASDPDFIWVALGGGKQEIWMMNNYKKLNKGIMTGVGAAFRFYLGDIRRAPVFFQKIGMEWLFRLVQQPGKMAGRYMNTLPLFALYSVSEYFKPNSKLKNN